MFWRSRPSAAPTPPAPPSPPSPPSPKVEPSCEVADGAPPSARRHVDLRLHALPAAVEVAIERALRGTAHGLLIDPEEHACYFSLLCDTDLEPAGSCPIAEIEGQQPKLDALDGCTVVCGESQRDVLVYTSVTDLGRRTVVQLFSIEADEETRASRRKTNVRLVNRLRPGTSLSQHSRRTLERAVRRASQGEGPSFVARMRQEGLLGETFGDEDGDDASLTRALALPVLPRKAMARLLAEHLGLTFVDVEENLPSGYAGLLTREQILSWEAIPCGEVGESLEVAMADPTDADAASALVDALGRSIIVRVAASTDIRVAVDKLLRPMAE